MAKPCISDCEGDSHNPARKEDSNAVPATSTAFATCADDAGTDGTTVPASREDVNTVPSIVIASALVLPQHANPIEQVTPMPEVLSPGQASTAGKRSASRDTHSLPEAQARAKAKAKAVPKPKGARRRLRDVPSNPESRIATINSIRDARNHPYLPPESNAPDD